MSATKASSIVGSGHRRGDRLRLQLVRRAKRNRLSAVDERDSVAVLRLVHEVRGDHHGDPLFDEAVDVRPELAAGDRVDARGGLVEKERLGLVHHRAREGEPLLEARAAAPSTPCRRCSPSPKTSIICSICRRLRAPGQSVHAGEEVEGSGPRSGRHTARTSAPCSRGARELRPCRAAGRIPATRPSPAVGLSSPQSIRNVVDLPAPLGPSSPKISPRDTSNEMSDAAVKSPKRLVSARASITGSDEPATVRAFSASFGVAAGAAAEDVDE